MKGAVRSWPSSSEPRAGSGGSACTPTGWCSGSTVAVGPGAGPSGSRIAGADVIAAGQGATLRIVGPAGPLDVEMLSSWEATLASELIAGLRDIADVQAGRSGDDH